MATNAVALPFSQPDFFDRFEAGKTVLYLEFVHPETKQDIRTQKEETNLCSAEVLGIYAGREGGAIKINSGFGAEHKIRAADIRGIKEISPGEVKACIQCIEEAAALQGNGPGIEWIQALNRVRAFVAVNSLFLPHLRLP